MNNANLNWILFFWSLGLFGSKSTTVGFMMLKKTQICNSGTTLVWNSQEFVQAWYRSKKMGLVLLFHFGEQSFSIVYWHVVFTILKPPKGCLRLDFWPSNLKIVWIGYHKDVWRKKWLIWRKSQIYWSCIYSGLKYRGETLPKIVFECPNVLFSPSTTETEAYHIVQIRHHHYIFHVFVSYQSTSLRA